MTAAASTRDPGQLGPVPDAPGPPTRKACHPHPPRGPGCRGRYARAARAALAGRVATLLASGLTYRRAAEVMSAELGHRVSLGTVHHWANDGRPKHGRHGPRPHPDADALLARARALRADGLSYEAVADRMGDEFDGTFCGATVRGWLVLDERPSVAIGRRGTAADPAPPSIEEIRRWCDVLRPTSAECDRRKARDGDREWARYSPTFGRLCAILDRED